MTTIEWTDMTWNPTAGCTVISHGCTNCYAMRMAARCEAMGQDKYKNTVRKSGNRTIWTGTVNLVPSALSIPYRWKSGKMVFVNSMSDVFHDAVPLDFQKQIFEVMVDTPQHIYQVLTKRAENLEAHAPSLPWTKNIWMGVSVESSDYLWRIDHLRRTPAHIKFLSIEPLLEPLVGLDLTNIDWVIVGGESGPRSRPMHADWVRAIRDQCVAAGVKFFFKQWGGTNKKAAGRLLDGVTHDEFP